MINIACPTVSIGLPVFNGGTMVDEAIRGCLRQDFADFELLISDNASTDGTRSVCERYASLDPRIRYVRQPENLGALGNFQFVINHAHADLFCWAAVDDVRSPDFISANIAFLRANPGHIGSVTPTRFEGVGDSGIPPGDDVLTAATPGQRMVDFLRRSHGNSVFYGVFRRTDLLRALEPIAWYFGFDWTVMLRLASIGPIGRTDKGWLERGAGGESSRDDIIARSRTRPIHWVLPFYDLTREALRLASLIDPRSRRRVIASLIRLNLSAMRHQARYEARRLIRSRRG